MIEVTRKRWLSYWRLAWKNKPAAKRFSLVRTVPSVLIALTAFLIKRARGRPNSLEETYAVIATTLGVYLLLYVLEIGWNFGCVAPVFMDANGIGVLDRQGDRQIDSVRERLTNFSEGEKSILRFILDNGVVTFVNLQAAGFESALITGMLQKGRAHALVMAEHRPRSGPVAQLLGSGPLPMYRINESLEATLRTLLD